MIDEERLLWGMGVCPDGLTKRGDTGRCDAGGQKIGSLACECTWKVIRNPDVTNKPGSRIRVVELSIEVLGSQRNDKKSPDASNEA